VINAGQARLSNTIARATGADLAVGGSVDLADGTLEARLLLFGSGGASSPLSARPEVTIALRGPVSAPRRTIELPRSPTGWHYGRSSSNRRSWTRSKAASRLHHPPVLRSIPTRDPPRTKGVSAPSGLLVSGREWRRWRGLAIENNRILVMPDTSTQAVPVTESGEAARPRFRHPL
jgi:hypothetical protein